jgi:hypothetical protein
MHRRVPANLRSGVAELLLVSLTASIQATSLLTEVLVQ